MIDLSPLHITDKLSSDRVKIGIAANLGSHTNELICGVSFALSDELESGSKIAKRVSFVWKDDERSASKASQVVKEFTEEDVHYVIGHLSASASIPASEIYSQKGICFLATGTTNPELCRKDKPYVLRFCPLHTCQAKLMVSFLEEKIKNLTIHLIVQDIKYVHTLSNLITSYNKNNKQAVIICAIHEYASNYINKIVESGWSGIFIAGDDCDIANFCHLLDYRSLDIYIPKIVFSENISKCFDFNLLNEKYIMLRNETPGAYFYTSYAACRMLVNAMENAKNINANTIYRILINNTISSTFSIPFTFDAEGNARELKWEISHLKT